MAASKYSSRGGILISGLWCHGDYDHLSPPTAQVECVVETRDREHALSLKKALEKEYGDLFIMWGERKPSFTSLT